MVVVLLEEAVGDGAGGRLVMRKVCWTSLLDMSVKKLGADQEVAVPAAYAAFMDATAGRQARSGESVYRQASCTVSMVGPATQAAYWGLPHSRLPAQADAHLMRSWPRRSGTSGTALNPGYMTCRKLRPIG